MSQNFVKDFSKQKIASGYQFLSENCSIFSRIDQFFTKFDEIYKL